MATKIPKEVLKYFQKTGSEGGKARAERHSKKQLSDWGKLGGRPKGRNKKQKLRKAARDVVIPTEVSGPENRTSKTFQGMVV